MPEKTCSCCKLPKDIGEFGRNIRSPDGRHWYCRACNNKKQREWKKANVDKVKRWRKGYVDRVKAGNDTQQTPLSSACAPAGARINEDDTHEPS
jgi:hypothetical protein